ncbi:CHC2 zinc finger domain-containing protein [Pseudomonas cichorii]|uniref:CHC2 zinc finger domain-containing protein n=1 Tax=Pseudomonas cichorii TaxID=36746 RepID=UPI001C899061|nr:CHC2 zinc finger domain-containing protein [Pseudomonas cichorii]MBX8498221.1 hypothetical protein [Pseudomonas cichorii]
MARIPEAELERLKREVSLVRLIQSQGHELKKRGKDWVMHRVFHDESVPSLSVSDEKNRYHCFGCEAAGSVIDWVMKTQAFRCRTRSNCCATTHHWKTRKKLV